jgi:hypothetical protein
LFRTTHDEKASTPFTKPKNKEGTMALSNPLFNFGIHQATLRDLVTNDLFTMLVLEGGEADFSQDLIDLRGGSSAFPWASAPGEAKGELKLTVKEYNAGVMKYFSPWVSGAVVEDTDGEVAGNVSSPVNAVGTSIINATTGIATIASSDSGVSLKFGDYIVKYQDATHVDLYVNANVDGAVYVNDALKINSSPLEVKSAGVTSNGLTITGGSGTIALTPGDMATFSVRPISNYLLQHYIGKIGSAPYEFELTLLGERIGSKIRCARYPRCISSGGSGLKFLYKNWASFETTIKLLQDPVLGAVGIETFINR